VILNHSKKKRLPLDLPLPLLCSTIRTGSTLKRVLVPVSKNHGKNTKVQYNLQEAQSNALIELGSHWPLLPYY